MKNLLLALALLGGAAALPACVTAGQGEVMRSEISELRTRLDAMDRRDKDYSEQVVRLRKVLDEATALLTRNSADLGAKVAKLETDLQAQSGRIEELRHQLEQLAKQQSDDKTERTSERTRIETRVTALADAQAKLGERLDKLAPPMPEDKDALFREAGERVKAGQREDGRRFYRAFVQRFAQDPRAPQALLAIGDSFTADNKSAQAAGEYQKVLDSYPKSPEAPDAMWKLAGSFVDLKFCSDARAILEDLVKRYPKSARAAESRERLRQLQKWARDREKCTS